VESTTPVLWLKHFYPRPSDTTYLARIMRQAEVTIVLDVGANTGQFAKSLRLGGYLGRIVSFEPLSSAHGRLVRAAKRDCNWSVAPRMAIGDHDGSIEINIAGNGVSSSILGMLPAHLAADPDSAYVGREMVPMRTLDGAAAKYVRREDRIFLKADVQGAENCVLAGAANLLPQVVGLQLELSLVPCYRDQLLFFAMTERMGRLGYSLWALSPGATDERTGRQLQCDGVFVRESRDLNSGEST
jgi:FkbM family methyltransferase